MTKKQAQSGDIELYKKQGKAIWENGVRQSEHEHALPRKNLQQQSTDPSTGEHSYDQKAYDNTHTLTIPKDMANLKTHGPLKTHLSDMELIRETAKLIESPQEPSEYLNSEMRIEAAEGRMREARDLAIEHREKAGLSTVDLKVITDEKIKEAVVLGFGEASQDMNRNLGLIPKNQIRVDIAEEKNKVLKGEKSTTDYGAVFEQKLSKPLAGATEADKEQLLEPLNEHGQRSLQPEKPPGILSGDNTSRIPEQSSFKIPGQASSAAPSTLNLSPPPGSALSQPHYSPPPAQPPLSASTAQTPQPGAVLSSHQQGQLPSAAPTVPAPAAPPASPLGVMKFK